jgi:hypothetical protein
MTAGDLAHLMLVFAGFVAGLSVGLRHGPLGALVGAATGAVAAHLLALLAWAAAMVAWGFGQIWTDRFNAKKNRSRK